MKDMMDCDWVCLARIARGEHPPSSSSTPSHGRLEAMNFIVARPHNTLAITGLGRDALTRRQYRLSPPIKLK